MGSSFPRINNTLLRNRNQIIMDSKELILATEVYRNLPEVLEKPVTHKTRNWKTILKAYNKKTGDGLAQPRTLRDRFHRMMRDYERHSKSNKPLTPVELMIQKALQKRDGDLIGSSETTLSVRDDIFSNELDISSLSDTNEAPVTSYEPVVARKPNSATLNVQQIVNIEVQRIIDTFSAQMNDLREDLNEVKAILKDVLWQIEQEQRVEITVDGKRLHKR